MSEANEMTNPVDAVVRRIHHEMLTQNDGNVRGFCRVNTPDLIKLVVNVELRLTDAKIERIARIIADRAGENERWQDYLLPAISCINAMYDFA